jgi:hypothetical protein
MRTPRVIMAALLFCAALPTFAANRFGEIVEAFSSLQAGPAAPVNNVTFNIGHMKMTLKSGTAAPIRAAGDVVAIYFKGDGTMEYESADPIEQPILKHNSRGQNVTVTAQGNGAKVTGSINEMILYAAGVPLPKLAEGGGSDLSASFKDFQKEMSRLEQNPVVNSFLLQNFMAPARQYARAEIRSGRDQYAYLYDGLESMYEYLLALRQPDTDVNEFKRRLFPTPLSLQPIGFDRKSIPPQPVVLTAVDYTLVADGNNAKLDVTETIQRQSETQKAIRLSLNTDYFAGPGKAFRQEHLLSVTDSQGRSLPFNHKFDEVVIGLEGVTGTSITLKFAIEGDFLIRPNMDNFWQLGTTAWFPMPENLGGQYYTVHSIVKTKKPFIPIAPGATVRRVEEGDFNVVENTIDKPIQFAVVHAGKYDIYEETRAGLTVRVASYGGKNDRAAKQLTNLAYQIIDYYQWFLGPFPFDHLNIVQVNTFGYGQAPPATMFITNEAFNSMVGEVNQFFSQGINERFAHEIAHQYWGHVVKMPSGEEQWLTETFAEYTAALMIKKMKGNDDYQKMVNFWKERAGDSIKVAPIPLANYIGGSGAGRHRQSLLYFKGAYVLYKLHQELGDNQFLTFMKSYQKSFRWKFGTTNDVAGLLQFVTKKDYTDFLNRYFWGTEMP